MMVSQNFNRRHSPNRRKTRVDAVLEVDGREHPVVILDISFQGMRLTTPHAIEQGSPVMIHVLSRRIPAIVHWSRAGHVGVHLLARLEAQTLIAIENADDDLAAFR